MRAVRVVGFVVLVLFFVVNTASAISYTTYGTTSYVTFFDGDSGTVPVAMVYDYVNDRIIYADNDNGVIKAFYPQYPTSQASTSAMVLNATGVKAIGLTTGGNIVFGGTDNKVYLVDDFSGLIDMNNPLDDDYFSVLYTTIADISHITVDANDNIYVSDINEHSYKISQPYYMASQLQNLPATSSNINGMALEPYSAGFVLPHFDSSGGPKAIFDAYNPDTQIVGDRFYIASIASMPNVQRPICAYLSNDDMVIVYCTSDAGGTYQWVKYLNSSDSYSSQTLFKATIGTTVVPHFNDVVINKDGLVYLALDDGGFLAVDTGGVVTSYPYQYTMNPSSPSGGDSGTVSDSDFTVGESHEWTNDEILSALRMYVPNIFILLLLFYFIYVIGGK